MSLRHIALVIYHGLTASTFHRISIKVNEALRFLIKDLRIILGRYISVLSHH